MSGNNNSKLKQQYISYFNEVPVQKYAAMYIGRDEDTIIRWRKEDASFADAVKRAKAEWVRKKLFATKAEFALERLERDIFSPKLDIAFESTALQERNEQVHFASPQGRQIIEAFDNWLLEHTKAVQQQL